MCWRRNLDSVQKRMLAVMNNNIPDIPHDVAFVVGEEKVKISCHKIFLAILSPVFEAMFSRRHNPKETPTTGMGIVSSSSTSKCNPIPISDVQPQGLKNIMKYAYTGVMSVDLKDVRATMYASHKYDIPELTQYCSELLHSNLSVNNVVTIYQASTILNEMKLKEKAWEFIQDNGGALLDSKEFVEFSEENLLKFLSLDEIPDLKSEVDVFKAVVRWGNFQCGHKGLDTTKENLRTVLKNYISLIRFPSIELNDFNEIVEPSCVLTSKDCIRLFKYFTASDEKRISIGETLPYSNKNRADHSKCYFCTAAITDKLEISTAGQQYDRFTFSGNTDVIKLKSVGIVLPLNFTPPGAGKSVSVCLNDLTPDIWTHTVTKMISKPLEISYIEFENPVSLKSNVQYQLRINYSNGATVPDPVKVVKYSNILLKQSSFTCYTTNRKKFIINFNPNNHVIWALQFEN